MTFRRLHARSHLSLLLLGVMLAPASAAAQLTFGGIPWSTPVDSATSALQRAGYVLRGQDQEGDRVFWGPRREEVVAAFDSAGLVGVGLEWGGDPEWLPGRFERLADSLSAMLGSPAQPMSDADEHVARWERDGVAVTLHLRPRGDGRDSALDMRYEGPRWIPEVQRRDQAWRAFMAHQDEYGPSDSMALGDWHIVHANAANGVHLDTVKRTVMGDRRFGARLLYDGSRRRLDNGLIYDGAVREVELDCGRGRIRLQRTIFLYALRTAAIVEVPRGERRWDQPPPGSDDVDVLAAACAVLEHPLRPGAHPANPHP